MSLEGMWRPRWPLSEGALLRQAVARARAPRTGGPSVAIEVAWQLGVARHIPVPIRHGRMVVLGALMRPSAECVLDLRDCTAAALSTT